MKNPMFSGINMSEVVVEFRGEEFELNEQEAECSTCCGAFHYEELDNESNCPDCADELAEAREQEYEEKLAELGHPNIKS